MKNARALALARLGRLLDDRTGKIGDRSAPEADDPREGRLAAELAHGSVRHLSRIDRVLARAAGRPVAKIERGALGVLRIGVYQLLFTPSIPAYAAVSESVALARAVAPRAAGFVNWVLRRVGPEDALPPPRSEFGSDEAWLAATHSFPLWMARRWVRRLGADEAGRLMEALNAHPPPGARVNVSRATREQVSQELDGEGVRVEDGRYAPCAILMHGGPRPSTLAAFREGRLYLQDESSQLAPLALAPRPGERILDACAGLGGKSTHLAEIAGGGASITAVDRSAERLRLLDENVRRLGLSGIAPCRGDVLSPALLEGQSFDRILLDVPCSGLGTIARHPELKWAKRAADPARLAATQRRLLDRAAGLLAPGGLLAYSTCTTEPEENEEVVKSFLQDHPGFAVEPPPGGVIDHAGELLTPEGFLRAWPHRHGIGGAFVALLRAG